MPLNERIIANTESLLERSPSSLDIHSAVEVLPQDSATQFVFDTNPQAPTDPSGTVGSAQEDLAVVEPSIDAGSHLPRRRVRSGVLPVALLCAGVAALGASDRADARFHFVDTNVPAQWADLANSTKWPGSREFIVANEPLADPGIRRAQRISTGWIETKDSGNPNRHTPSEVARLITRALNPANPHHVDYVIIDELKLGTVDKVKQLTATMISLQNIKRRDGSKRYGFLEGNWGIALVDGPGVSYSKLNRPSGSGSYLPKKLRRKGAIDMLLKANAGFAPEFYINSNAYFRNLPLKIRGKGPSGEPATITIPFGQLSPVQRKMARNLYMRDYIGGNGPYFPNAEKTDWLVRRKFAKRSRSEVSPILGVNDRFVGGATRPEDMLDQQYQAVLKTRYGRYLMKHNPLGSWKYSRARLSSARLDNFMVNANQHYFYKQLKGKIRSTPVRLEARTARGVKMLKKRVSHGYNEAERARNYIP